MLMSKEDFTVKKRKTQNTVHLIRANQANYFRGLCLSAVFVNLFYHKCFHQVLKILPDGRSDA